MTETKLSRRSLLAAALASGAFYAVPGIARAQADAVAGGAVELGPAQPFTFEDLKNMAHEMSKQSYMPPDIPDAKILEQIDYDKHNEISFIKDRSLWEGDASKSTVRFFFPGRYFKDPVRIYMVKDGVAREVPFSEDFFNIPEGNPARQLKHTKGYAGFSVQDHKTGADWLAFLGASYWRSSGYSGQFGLSVRGLAIDTANPDGPEEFPRFTRFWLDPGEDGSITIYALLESPSATGAYKIVSSKPAEGVTQQVTACICLRKDVERLGIAPLTSMYWYGKPNAHLAPDWRPEVHDSNGLEIHSANGEKIWRPLNNPPRVMTNSFSSPSIKGFGLIQRDHDFADYQDDGVFYDKRASAWVAPGEDWGDGAVTLVEIPTNDEIHDNIVAFWTPGGKAKAGTRYDLTYRLTWYKDTPMAPTSGRFIATRMGRGGIPGQPRPKSVIKIVCDFAGPGVDKLKRNPGLKPVVTTSAGSVSNLAAYPVVSQKYARAMFDLDVSKLPKGDDTPIDLRMFVEDDGKAVTETWIGQLFPSQIREILQES